MVSQNLSPSGAWLRYLCTNSHTLKQRVPDRLKRASVNAEEGVIAHKVFAAMLQHKIACDTCDTCGKIDGANDEMLECADACIAELDRAGAFKKPEKLLYVEKKLSYSIGSIKVNCVLDFAYYDQRANTVYVCDYKYGRQIVNSDDNAQLLLYTYALLQNQPSIKQPDVVNVIMQPRVRSGFCTAKYTHAQYLQAVSKYLHSDAIAHSGSGEFNVGGHCKYCTANVICKKLDNTSIKLADDVLSSQDSDFDDVTKYAVQYDSFTNAVKILNAKLNALETIATYKLRAGDYIPRMQLTAGRNKLYWSADEKTLKDAELLLGCEIFKKPSTYTVVQVLKKIKDKKYIKNLIGEKSGGDKLVTISDDYVQKIFNKTEDK